MTSIDRKFKIEAVCLAHGHSYTEEHGVFFKAADAAFNRRVPAHIIWTYPNAHALGMLVLNDLLNKTGAGGLTC